MHFPKQLLAIIASYFLFAVPLASTEDKKAQNSDSGINSPAAGAITLPGVRLGPGTSSDNVFQDSRRDLHIVDPDTNGQTGGGQGILQPGHRPANMAVDMDGKVRPLLPLSVPDGSLGNFGDGVRFVPQTPGSVGYLNWQSTQEQEWKRIQELRRREAQAEQVLKEAQDGIVRDNYNAQMANGQLAQDSYRTSAAPGSSDTPSSDYKCGGRGCAIDPWMNQSNPWPPPSGQMQANSLQPASDQQAKQAQSIYSCPNRPCTPEEPQKSNVLRNYLCNGVPCTQEEWQKQNSRPHTSQPALQGRDQPPSTKTQPKPPSPLPRVTSAPHPAWLFLCQLTANGIKMDKSMLSACTGSRSVSGCQDLSMVLQADLNTFNSNHCDTKLLQ